MKRILLAGLVGGVVLFVWGAISHMVLPTGSAGLKPLPNEDVLLPALRESVGEPGFPGAFTGAEAVDLIGGALLCGLAIARIVPPHAG